MNNLNPSVSAERLLVLRAVAREGGFTAAARRLGRTQPAVSQAVRALERAVGEPLLVRSRRGVRPTPAGEALLEHAERIHAELEGAAARLRGRRTLESGELRLGTSDTSACYVLPPVLEAFRRSHPGVEIRIQNHPTPAVAEAVARLELDLGFVTLPLPDPRLEAEALLPREEVVICAPGHPLAGRRRLRLSDLLPHPLLLLGPAAWSRRLLDERLRAAGGGHRVALETGSIEVIKRLVELDFGVAVVPRHAVGREVDAGRLAQVPLADAPGPLALGFVRPAGSAPSPAAAAFRALARRILPGPAAARARGRSPRGARG